MRTVFTQSLAVVELDAMATPEQKKAFCAALADSCNVGRAAAAIGVSRSIVFKWRKEDPEFAAMWESALEVGVTALEDEAHRRAFEGHDEPVWFQGQAVGAVRKYSDSLAMFLLKAHRPARYKDNAKLELTGENGGPVMLGETERAARISAILAAAEARRQLAPPIDVAAMAVENLDDRYDDCSDLV